VVKIIYKNHSTVSIDTFVSVDAIDSLKCMVEKQ